MAIELKSSDDGTVEIHDEVGQIGQIFYVALDENDPLDTTEGWFVELRGFPYVGTKSAGPCASAAHAFAAVTPLYEELLEVRRTAERFHRNRPVTVVSTPMGGQPR